MIRLFGLTLETSDFWSASRAADVSVAMSNPQVRLESHEITQGM